MKPLIFNADLIDPVDVARRDYVEFFIENVISYRGNLKRKTELEFQVKRLGYDETHNSWEPYANLRDSDQLHVVLRQNNLLCLIPKSFAKKLHTVNSLESFDNLLPFLPLQLTWLKIFGSFLYSKILTSPFCMSYVHAHNSQLKMQTLLAVDSLSHLLAFH